jgi:hypothetical protein
VITQQELQAAVDAGRKRAAAAAKAAREAKKSAAAAQQAEGAEGTARAVSGQLPPPVAASPMAPSRPASRAEQLAAAKDRSASAAAAGAAGGGRGASAALPATGGAEAGGPAAAARAAEGGAADAAAASPAEAEPYLQAAVAAGADEEQLRADFRKLPAVAAGKVPHLIHAFLVLCEKGGEGAKWVDVWQRGAECGLRGWAGADARTKSNAQQSVSNHAQRASGVIACVGECCRGWGARGGGGWGAVQAQHTPPSRRWAALLIAHCRPPAQAVHARGCWAAAVTGAPTAAHACLQAPTPSRSGPSLAWRIGLWSNRPRIRGLAASEAAPPPGGCTAHTAVTNRLARAVCCAGARCDACARHRPPCCTYIIRPCNNGPWLLEPVRQNDLTDRVPALGAAGRQSMARIWLPQPHR